jgi:hypothetical protein
VTLYELCSEERGGMIVGTALCDLCLPIDACRHRELERVLSMFDLSEEPLIWQPVHPSRVKRPGGRWALVCVSYPPEAHPDCPHYFEGERPAESAR